MIDKEKAAELGVLSMGTLFTGVLGRIVMFSPTEHFCQKDGVVLQLWVDKGSSDIADREWRPLPSFEASSKMFSCTKVVE